MPALKINSKKYNSYLNRKTRAFSTSEEEIRDLIKAWFMISLAFAIVLGGLSKNIVINFLVASISVGLGFILHELAHKIVAQKYGAFAEFRAMNKMLVLALITSFFGIIFAAPGAVYISGRINAKANGLISLAGPATNFVLSLLFFLWLPFTSGILTSIAQYGYIINAWLGLFNMVPILNLDGKKILAWDKKVYVITLIIGFIVFNLKSIF